MMPRTANGVIDEESLDERSAVMRALRPDRKHLGPTAHQQHLLITHMTDQLTAVSKLIESDALRQVATAEFRLVLIHSPISSKE